MRSGDWTETQVEELKLLWASDDSASIIGGKMGFTRNAILGKVHRLGLEFRSARNGSFYKPPKLSPPRSVYRSRERKPSRKNEKAPPSFLTTTSPITGAHTSTWRRAVQPEYTKAQLRAQLTEAVQNTARLV